MSDKAHSDYGGSVAEKWLNCPGYVDAVKDLPESAATIHTSGGTAQHALNETVLTTGKRPEEFIGKPWMDVEPEFEKNLYDEGNVERCKVWVDAIYEHFDPMSFKLDFEEKVVLSSISPEIYGSADLIAIDRERKILGVPDYKDGQGFVDIITTPQPPFYAVGADDLYGLGVDASWTVKYMIVQPKMEQPVTFREVNGNDVIEWRGVFRRAYTRSKACPTLRVAGDHCHWCRRAGDCPAKAEARRLSIRADFAGPTLPANLTPEQISNILRVAPEVESWLDDVKQAALAKALAGSPPPGFKLVEGRAGGRKWGDEAAAAEYLVERLGERAYERSLLSPAKAEKMLGKIPFQGIAANVTQTAGKPNLAPVGSEREEYDRQKQARAEFTE